MLRNDFINVLAERFTATAGAGGVGVAYFKTFAVQPVIKMNGRTIQVSMTGGINEEFDALAFKFEVTVFAHIKRHAILKTRTTAGFDEHSELRAGRGLLLQDLDLLGGRLGEVNHAS